MGGNGVGNMAASATTTTTTRGGSDSRSMGGGGGGAAGGMAMAPGGDSSDGAPATAASVPLVPGYAVIRFKANNPGERLCVCAVCCVVCIPRSSTIDGAGRIIVPPGLPWCVGDKHFWWPEHHQASLDAALPRSSPPPPLKNTKACGRCTATSTSMQTLE